MKLLKKPVIFLIGGSSYVGLELLWRGRSHRSMFLAGGLCLLLIGHQEKLSPKPPLPVRVLAGAGIITAVELGTGLVVNRDHSVWDYRDLPGNWLGQICLPFSFAWIPLSYAAGRIYCRLDRFLSKE